MATAGVDLVPSALHPQQLFKIATDCDSVEKSYFRVAGTESGRQMCEFCEVMVPEDASHHFHVEHLAGMLVHTDNHLGWQTRAGVPICPLVPDTVGAICFEKVVFQRTVVSAFGCCPACACSEQQDMDNHATKLRWIAEMVR